MQHTASTFLADASDWNEEQVCEDDATMDGDFGYTPEEMITWLNNPAHDDLSTDELDDLSVCSIGDIFEPKGSRKTECNTSKEKGFSWNEFCNDHTEEMAGRDDFCPYNKSDKKGDASDFLSTEFDEEYVRVLKSLAESMRRSQMTRAQIQQQPCPQSFRGLAGFISGRSVTLTSGLEHSRKRLRAYMAPSNKKGRVV